MLSPVIGGFEIRERLGERDGIATYRAVSTRTGERVLLRLARDHGAAKRLRSRARQLAAAEELPGVRPLLGLEEMGGQVMAVSRDAGGWRLSDMAGRGGFDDARAGRLATQVERAAHLIRRAGLAPEAFRPADIWIERVDDELHVLVDLVESTGAGPSARGDIAAPLSLLVPGSDDGHRRERVIGASPPSALESMFAGRLPLWLAGGVAALAVASTLGLVLGGEDARPRAASPVSVATTSASAGAQIVEIAVPASITAGPVFAGDVGWLADSDQMTLLPIDPGSGRQAGARVEIGPGTGRPLGLRLGAGALWAVDSVGGRVARVDPTSRLVTSRVAVTPRIAAFSVDAGGLTVIRRDDTFAPGRPTRLVRYDQATLKRRSESGLPRPATGAASGPGNLWVALGSGLIARVGPRGRLATTRDVGGSARISAVGLGALWVTDLASGRLLRLDPRTLATKDTYTGPGRTLIVDLDIGPLGVLALVRERGTGPDVATSLQALNPATLAAVGDPIALPAPATSIVQSADAVWARAPGRLLRITLPK